MKKLLLSTLLLAASSSSFASTSEWREYQGNDPFTDESYIRLTLSGRFLGVLDDHKMVATCKNNKTEIYVNFNDYLDNDAVKVTYRFDDNKAKTNIWDISTGGTAVFSQKPIGFIKEMMKSEKLIIRARNWRGVDKIAYFNVKGLSEKIGNLRKTCNW